MDITFVNEVVHRGYAPTLDLLGRKIIRKQIIPGKFYGGRF
jgi:hypothetical protein